MSDHLLSATLLAFTLFAAHLFAAQARSLVRYSIDGGPVIAVARSSLDLARLPRGRHTIELEIP